MTKKIDTLKYYKKQSFWAKCLCASNIAYIVTTIGVISLIVIVYFIFVRLSNVKLQLESCRSSCRSNV